MVERFDEVFRALSDPTRRALFERLSREGEQSVRALTAFAGVSQPAVSKHLGVLKKAGLVRDRKSGRETLFRTDSTGLRPLIDWVSYYGALWEHRFDDLEGLADRMAGEPR